MPSPFVTLFVAFGTAWGKKENVNPTKMIQKENFGGMHACMQIYLKKVQQSFLKTQIIVTSKLDPVLLTICN